VLWSDEVTFQIGGRTAKEKIIHKRGERTHLYISSTNFTAGGQYQPMLRELLGMDTRALFYLLME
jgi:hypothetical protein